MRFVTHTVRGPLTASVSQEEAKSALIAHKDFPANADPESVKIDDVNGRWVASFRVAADVPPFMEGGGGPPESDSKPPSEDSGEDQSDFTDGEPKEKEDKPKEDKSEKSELKEVIDLVKQIAEAVGVAPNPEDSPVPGPDGPEGLGPDGPIGPPDAGPGPDADSKQHIVHERALKPGETPPGGVPVGATTFAKAKPINPFPDFIGKTAFFNVETDETISIASATREVNSLVAPFGYSVYQANHIQDKQGKKEGVKLVVTNRPIKR